MNGHSVNTTPQLVRLAPAPRQGDEDINYLGILDSLWNSRRLIAGVTLGALALAAAYSVLSTPVYKADSLIQVEQSERSSGNNILGNLSAVFNVPSSAAAESEVLRSRMVVGQAVDELKLHISARPNYVPVVGEWLSRQVNALSDPLLKGMKGYVWGNESISVEQLDVPQPLLDQKLQLIARDSGYDLLGPEGELLAAGKIGQAVRFERGGETGRILVSELHGKQGARFILTRHSTQEIIKDLQTDLAIAELNKPSGILSVSLEGSDANKVAGILNALGAAYVEQNVQLRAAEAEKSLAFLDEFLPELKAQLDESENRYTAFRDEHRTFDLGTEGELTLRNSVTLQTQLFELQQRRRELGALYGPEHPSVVAVNQQIGAAELGIANLAVQIKKLPELEQKLLNLQRDVRVNGELYASLLNNRQQLRLVKEGKVGSVRVVDAAVAPLKPVRPDPPVVLTLAGFGGLLFGSGLALMRSRMQAGIRSASEIEEELGLHVYSIVPRALPHPSRTHLRSGANTHVLAELAPRDPAIESLRSLRTALRFGLQEAPNNIVLVTGPTPDIGKTFTSVNLASVVAAANARVLLIDMDFRSGHIHRYFGIERLPGFTDLIRRHSSFEEVVHNNVMPNVDLITTGLLPADPAELLLQPEVTRVLDQLATQYDVVLLDTAPVLAVSDATAIARHAGTVLMLARSEVTTLGELDEATKRLTQTGAKVKGVIFNDYDPSGHRFSARYGANHGRYGYGRHDVSQWS